ncbi:anti-sigma regulatory factor [Tumidithrix elongata RA019]|uniref:Anti-sigma regulatory factor n=1 Tax=Tumidithrix elongata BACA0141 TaxID=2716417 RepID=A0AAW9PR45_9CYAN|nr:anti-sigma regulatory factor [Tumidithrix elongata RA019]
MSTTIEFQAKTDLDELSQVLIWFNQLYRPFIPKMDWMKCQTALAEAFTNAVRHAHQGKPAETPIWLEASITDRSIEFKIWDLGVGFDLEKKLANLSRVVDPEATGGRGLDLLDQIADILSYRRTEDDRNCLHLVRHYLANPELDQSLPNS